MLKLCSSSYKLPLFKSCLEAASKKRSLDVLSKINFQLSDPLWVLIAQHNNRLCLIGSFVRIIPLNLNNAICGYFSTPDWPLCAHHSSPSPLLNSLAHTQQQLTWTLLLISIQNCSSQHLGFAFCFSDNQWKPLCISASRKSLALRISPANSSIAVVF